MFIYLTLLLVVGLFSNRFIYWPPTSSYELEASNILQVKRQGGEKVAIYYRQAGRGMPTILWSHGNAEDIGNLEDLFVRFNSQGYGILAYDYPGYGQSDGEPNEKGCYESVETAYLYLTNDLKVSADDVIIYGQSVGSGPAVWIASQKPCAGLVLVSPFVSAFRVMTKVPLFPGDQFKNAQRISGVKAPLLVIHGDQDKVIKQWHGKKLYELHSGPKTFLDVPGAGHNNLYMLAVDDIFHAIDRFRSDIQE